MALSKTSRVMSLPPGEAAKLLPPEVIRMAGQVKAAAEGRATPNKGSMLGKGDDPLFAKLQPKTKSRNFDRNSDFKRKTTIGYTPPADR
jgi:hypothetical protein